MDTRSPFSYLTDMLDAAFPKQPNFMDDLKGLLSRLGFRKVPSWYQNPEVFRDSGISVTKEIPEFNITVHIETDPIDDTLSITTVIGQLPMSIFPDIRTMSKVKLDTMEREWDLGRKFLRHGLKVRLMGAVNELRDMMFNMIVTSGYGPGDLIDGNGRVKQPNLE